MARLPRLTVPGYPHHIIQRGNNRQVIFTSAEDREMLLGLLAENAARFGVALHSYVLMDTHIHLLATPATTDSIPKMMQAIGRSYVRYFNARQHRTGTLFEGRYKSTLIQADRYLLACMAYIDLNPVRAGMVTSAGDFAWSSYRHYAGQTSDKLITPHPLFWSLGNTPFAREAAYAELVQAGIAKDQERAFTDSALHGWALGDQPFVNVLQAQTPRRLSKAQPGRPRLQPTSE